MKLLTTAQTSEYLNIPKGTLEQWRYLGRGPKYLKLGNAIRYQIETLEAWIADRICESTSAYDSLPEATA